MTTQQDIQIAILRALYDGWVQDKEVVNLWSIRDQAGWDELTYDNVIDTLRHERLIYAYSFGGNYAIKPRGIVLAEQKGIPTADNIKSCQRLRTQLLSILGDLYDAQGGFASKHFDELATETATDRNFVLNNLLLLADRGYIKEQFRGSYKLTHLGLEAVEKWRQQSALAQELDEISQLKPHPRGQALQKLIAKTVEQEGWSQLEGVRTSHEEMDVIVYRGREYYLVECKWEQKPIGAPIVRELYGKLGNRVGVRGILLSMSGFATTAVQQVENYSSSKEILLFGSEDVHSIVNQETTFEELLNTKYGELAVRRKAIYK